MQEKWDTLMKAGKSVAHHWFAHVVPLYVMLFMHDASEVDILKWAKGLGIDNALLQGRSMGAHIQGMPL